MKPPPCILFRNEYSYKKLLPVTCTFLITFVNILTLIVNIKNHFNCCHIGTSLLSSVQQDFFSRKDILREIPDLVKLIKNWLTQSKKYVEVEESLQDLHQQMAIVKEAEANGICKHTLHSLPSRYDNYKKMQDAINGAMTDLDSLVTDCHEMAQRYTEALNLLETQQFSQWSTDFKSSLDQEAPRLFDLVKEFLQNAGQSGVISQCEQSERELEQLLQQQNVSAIKCLRLLQEYSQVIHQCPSMYFEKHRVYVIPKLCQFLQDSQVTGTCEFIYQQFHQIFDLSKYDPKITVKFCYQMNILYNDIATQLTKVYDELKVARSEESTVTVQRLYDEAKTSIAAFLRHERGAPQAFEFVIVSELLLLNQNFLTLETAASRQGDWLLKLTSRDGVWFLDDLTYNSNKAMEFVSYLAMLKQVSKNDDQNLVHVLNTLKAANDMYQSLQDLNVNFHTIILPESVKKMQSDDVSVLSTVSELNSIVINLGVSLNDIVLHLENNLKCIVMEMEVNVSKDLLCLYTLRERVLLLYRMYFLFLFSVGEQLLPRENQRIKNQISGANLCTVGTHERGKNAPNGLQRLVSQTPHRIYQVNWHPRKLGNPNFLEEARPGQRRQEPSGTYIES